MLVEISTNLSLIDTASKEYNYRIIILNSGLLQENINKVKQNACDGFKFVDLQ